MASTVSLVNHSISSSVAASKVAISDASKNIFTRANNYTQKLTHGQFTFPEVALIGGILGILAMVEIPWYLFGQKKPVVK
jgi:hypothetical protein